MNKKLYLSITGLVFFIGLACGTFLDKLKNDSMAVVNGPNNYFYDSAFNYLNSNKLDLPEEIAQMKDENDKDLEQLEGYRDTKDHIIHIRFARLSHSAEQLHEYQMDIDQDSLHIFDKGRYVGAVHTGNSPIDTLLIHDNE